MYALTKMPALFFITLTRKLTAACLTRLSVVVWQLDRIKKRTGSWVGACTFFYFFMPYLFLYMIPSERRNTNKIPTGTI